MALPFIIIGGTTVVTLGALYAARTHFNNEANKYWKQFTVEKETGWQVGMMLEAAPVVGTLSITTSIET